MYSPNKTTKVNPKWGGDGYNYATGNPSCPCDTYDLWGKCLCPTKGTHRNAEGGKFYNATGSETLSQAQKNVNDAQKNLNDANALADQAQKAYDNYSALYDAAKSSFDSCQADNKCRKHHLNDRGKTWEAAKLNLSSATSSLNSAKAAVEKAKQTLMAAQSTLKNVSSSDPETVKAKIQADAQANIAQKQINAQAKTDVAKAGEAGKNRRTLLIIGGIVVLVGLAMWGMKKFRK